MRLLTRRGNTACLFGCVVFLHIFGGSLAAEPRDMAQTFQRVLESVRQQAIANGVDRTAVDAALAGLSPDPAVLAQARAQAEFSRAIWDYLDQAVNPRRVENGQRLAREHQALLARIEAELRVPSPIVMGIWAMESSYGVILRQKGNAKDVIRSLATLVTDGGRRSAGARTELLAAIRILAENDVPRSAFIGSWAGAMGQVQFMPTTYLRFAVDFDHDGRRDIWLSVPDALGSAANYLAKSGWQAGKPWGYEVILPPGFNGRLVRRVKTASEWAALGVQRAHGLPMRAEDGPMKLILPAGLQGAAFLVTENFEALRAYNKSDAYALGVGLLADQIGALPGLAGSWPRAEPPLSQDEREEIQKRLRDEGLYQGEIDGRFGGESASAIRDYQERRGLAADGWPTRALLSFMRAH